MRGSERRVARPGAVLPLAALLAGAAAALLAGVARGQEAGGPDGHGPVHIEVMVTYVSSEPGSVDQRAQEMFDKLRREFIALQTLRILQLQQLSLRMHQMGQVDLPNGQHVRVTPEEVTPEGLRMGVEVQDMLRTHLHVHHGNDVLIGAHGYEDGKLVLRLKPR